MDLNARTIVQQRRATLFTNLSATAVNGTGFAANRLRGPSSVVSLNYRDGFPREIGCTLPRRTLPSMGECWVGVVAPQYHPRNQEHPIPGSSRPAHRRRPLAVGRLHSA